MLVLTQPLILDGSRQRAEEMKQSSCDNITSAGVQSTLYLQSPMGALEPGGQCTFDQPQPPAWIESDPAAVNKHRSVLVGITFRMKMGCCPPMLKCKRSPLPSLTRYPSMAGGILAVPLVSDQRALLDHHCSCNHIERMK